ncbi:MAG: hypothetical protein A2W03_14765 [Candidatus Aminicenantes bacterium RBG_16_63_16]|nr:MAG: hypothetical protein A2W03_14765 [Candidatus Aminicenantes bacterium RBG_16_63_16]
MVLLLVAFGACATKTATAPPSLKVGVGETVITPSEPTRMRGFARAQISTGVHDDLHARSLVVEDTKGETAALMTVALCGMSEDYLKAIREGITAETGIKPENIVVSCTHTHSGPNVGATPSTFNKEEVEASIASLAYRTFLVEQCVASAVKAWENRVPGRIGIASTKVLELGRNRRRLLYGGLHPDPEVAVIRVEDARGQLLGVAFNYGCHPSGIDWHNTLFTEDWPYYAIQAIKKQVGQEVWVAFYQSAEGDIGVGYSAELSAVGVDMPVRTYWYVEHKGNQMAGAVLAALPGIATSADADVRVAAARFDYPLRTEYPVSVEEAEREVADAKKRLAEFEKVPELSATRRADEVRVELFQAEQKLRTAKRYFSGAERPATRSLEQIAVGIGDAMFVTFPGELFSEIGLAIKEGSPLEKTYVIGVTCGPGGYLPSAKEFLEGDYEVNGSAYSPLTERFCVESSLDLIKRVAVAQADKTAK